jgi:hypothetical protein
MVREAGRPPDQIPGVSLETLKLQHYFIMAGFVLLILNSLGRRRAKAAGRGPLSWWGRYGDFIALGMVGAGLVGLALQK